MKQEAIARRRLEALVKLLVPTPQMHVRSKGVLTQVRVDDRFLREFGIKDADTFFKLYFGNDAECPKCSEIWLTFNGGYLLNPFFDKEEEE